MSTQANVRPLRQATEPDDHVSRLDWASISSELEEQGSRVIGKLLSPKECREISALYARDAGFRSTIVMARHGFGRGEYKYLSYPLPELIETLRGALYARLAPIANGWNERLGIAMRYPPSHPEFPGALP